MKMENVDMLATAKVVQKSRIKAAFSRAPQAGHTVSAGYVMDAAQEDIDNLTRLRNRMQETLAETVQIRDKRNQFHTVSVNDLTEIVGELVDFDLSLYGRKWLLESAIDAAETVEDVEAVVW